MIPKFLSASGALVVALGFAPGFAQSCPRDADAQIARLSLDQAIAKALESDLRPDAARAAVASARTERAIAALRPSDSVSLEFENFPGTGIAAEVENLEVTGTFSRVWERGGKREARSRVAERSVEIAEAGVDISRADIAFEIQSLYVDLALTQERASLAQARLDAARAAEELISKRVKAARDPLLAGSRASADALIAEGELARLKQDADRLRAALADFWAGPADFGVDLCSLSPDGAHVEHSLDIGTSPELGRIEAERRKAEAAIRLAEADRVPDVTWSAGVRKFGTDESLSVVGGISVPLGAPKRAAPYAQQAGAQARQLEAEADALRQTLLRETALLERTALGAKDALAQLEAGPIPEAERAVSLANDGYARGAFSYLDVLDAQRLLFDLREQRLDFLRTFHLAEAALARLQARNLPATVQETTP
jgi:cobalt-zinc-cadmium efflux system outer membrane protein